MISTFEDMATAVQTVLIVDDEPDMLRSLGRILRSRGLTVETAGSGEDAVERARELNPDAIVMDIKMPGISGLEAYVQIRDFQSDVYVILMTGFSELMEEARKTEGIKILVKPVDPNEICQLIASSAK
ncbi:MAG: CheY-like chemotaxis protein [Verrucomicrobiales bacterium]|jgi:CheY-like chemotaxis protein